MITPPEHFKTHLFFSSKATSGKARDFNWHHVFGIWTAVPLAVVVATATVFSYPWANDLVYRSVGEEPPIRGAPRGTGGQGNAGRPAATPAGAAPRSSIATPPGVSGSEGAARDGGTTEHGSSDWGSSGERATYDELVARAAADAGEWRSLTLNVPPPDSPTVRIGVDRSNGGQPQHRHTFVLDAATAAVQEWQPFSSQSTGQKARSWIRFLHTGEALGIAGQTIAGVVSLTSLLMVWTGLALAYRRLIVPLYARPN